jgi:hypothetical protein
VSADATVWHRVCDLADRLANPILVREMRAKFRGRRAFLTLAAFVTLECIAFFAQFMHYATATEYPTGSLREMPGVGRAVFEAFALVLIALVALFTPAAAAGAFALEREKKTLEFLELTLLAPWEIVAGKLAVSVLYVMLMGVTALPILSLVFILGGVSPGEVAVVFVVAAMLALTIGAIGVYQSAVHAKAQSATSVTYLVSGMLVMFVMSLLADGMRRAGARSWAIVFSTPSIPFFHTHVSPILLVGISTLVVVNVLVQYAAGQLRRREYDSSGGERQSLFIAYVAVLASYVGLSLPQHASFAQGALGGYAHLQLFMVMAFMFAPAVVPVTGAERRMPQAEAMRFAVSPLTGFSDRLTAFPGFQVVLSVAAAAILAATHVLLDPHWPPFWAAWTAVNLVLLVGSTGLALLLTASARAADRLFGELPQILRLTFVSLVTLSVFAAELLPRGVLSGTSNPDGLPGWAVALVYLSPIRALASADECSSGGSPSFRHFRSDVPWSDLAYFQGKHEVPACIGFTLLWLGIGIASLRAIAFLHRPNRPGDATPPRAAVAPVAPAATSSRPAP